jgi:signal transduction histidine kinase
VSYLRYVTKVVWNAWRRHWFDLVIVGIAILAAVEVVFHLDDSDGKLTGPTWLYAPWAAAMILPLLARRRYPFGAPAAVFVIGVVGSVVDGKLTTYTFGDFVGVLAASFLFGMLFQRDRSLMGLGIALGAAAFVVHNDPTQGLGDFGFIAFVLTIAWLAGLALGSQLTAAAQAIQRAEHLEREREAEARAAVAEERARIARELHDVVGHSVSVMTVQASAVRRLLTPEQEREREALLVVEQTGREALAEMRRLVGVLRRPEEAPALVPQPSLEHVRKLVEQTREAGLPTQLSVEGEASPLPAGIDLTAYRLVQEGLTNALKHANATQAEVLVRYEGDGVELVVRDNGTGEGNGGGSGHGLVGMRERVSVCGGQLEAGPSALGGYELRAHLPVTAA